MTPWDVVAKAAEIALRHGGEIAKAWEVIYQSLRAEMPELDERPLPAVDDEADAARAEGIEQQRRDVLRRAAELFPKEGVGAPISSSPPIGRTWTCMQCGARYGTKATRCICGGRVV
jgi:hypothetical protein